MQTFLNGSMITHCLQDAYECLQTSLNFDATFTAALPSTSSAVQPQCGAFSAHGNTSYCQQPVCQIYSVDMAFCGQEGLVTDQSQALLVMVCTQEVQVCLDCFTVSLSAVVPLQVLPVICLPDGQVLHLLLLLCVLLLLQQLLLIFN